MPKQPETRKQELGMKVADKEGNKHFCSRPSLSSSLGTVRSSPSHAPALP